MAETAVPTPETSSVLLTFSFSRSGGGASALGAPYPPCSPPLPKQRSVACVWRPHRGPAHAGGFVRVLDLRVRR